jgi:hypothetical protein
MFTCDGSTFAPYVPNNAHGLKNLRPDLFYYNVETPRIFVTKYPGILSPNYEDDGLDLKFGKPRQVERSTAVHGSMPVFTGDSFYGKHFNYTEDQLQTFTGSGAATLVHNAIDMIDHQYYPYITAVTISYIPGVTLRAELFPNLTHVDLRGCQLKEFPKFIIKMRHPQIINLSNNLDITEIPYQWHQITPSIRALDIRGTGIKCLWTRIVPAKCQWLVDEALVLRWTGRDSETYFIPMHHLKEIFARCARPVVAAATAILAIPKRRIVKNFHRDIATLIARMIMETRGRAVWAEM